jgi:Flp pilus assembly protein TadG
MKFKNLICAFAQRYSRRFPDRSTRNQRSGEHGSYAHRWRAFLHVGEDGQALVEMAFVTPVILLILTGILSFGIALNQYELLTYATGDAARAFALSRNQSSWTPTTAADPCEYTYQVAYGNGSTYQGAAPTLNPSNVTMTISYTPPSGSDHTAQNWTPTATSGCSTFALDGTDINGTVTVQTTYPVFPVIWGWSSTYKLNLTATSSEQIQ